MRRLFLLLTVSIMTVMPMMADNDKMITREELPEKAQTFLMKYFENSSHTPNLHITFGHATICGAITKCLAIPTAWYATQTT